MKIPVSFKEEEKVMYDYVNEKLSASIYIKQLIKDDMEKNKPQERKSKNTGVSFDF
jgi:hypothetical protein